MIEDLQRELALERQCDAHLKIEVNPPPEKAFHMLDLAKTSETEAEKLFQAYP